MKFSTVMRAFCLLTVATLVASATPSADAGLFDCLKKKKCCPCPEPEPVCCEPEPVCCEPAPEPCCEPVVVEEPCCEPEPAPCCPEPEPVCCEPEPCCDPCCPPKKGFFARLIEKCKAKRAAKCCDPCCP